MRGLHFRCVSVVLAMGILLLSLSSATYSQNKLGGLHKVNEVQKWRTNEPVDEGISTGTLILIGVGVAAVVTAIILISNSGSDDGEGENEGDMKDEEPGSEMNQSDKGDGVPISVDQRHLNDEQNKCLEEQIPFGMMRLARCLDL